MNIKGQLYLIPCPLGENEPLEVLPITVKNTIESLNYFIVENEKTTRRFIKRITPDKAQVSLNLFVLNKFTDISSYASFIKPCLDGESVGLISEAGCPGIADPGAEIVALAHQNQIKVVPLVGPSSILLAMMSSGLNGQSFTFNGYLPIDKNKRKRELKRLEQLSYEKNQTQIFIETPYRNNPFLEFLCEVLENNTLLCIACDITLDTEFIKTLPIYEWKKNKTDLNKRPAIFIIHKK